MTLSPGTRVGVYEIVAMLGAGDGKYLYAAVAETDADVVLLDGLVQ